MMFDILIRECKKVMVRTVMIIVKENSARRILAFDSMVKNVNKE